MGAAESEGFDQDGVVENQRGWRGGGAHLLFARERMVVTRHIGHDGFLIWPQGANDICPRNRGGRRRAIGRRERKRGGRIGGDKEKMCSVKVCRDKRPVEGAITSEATMGTSQLLLSPSQSG